MYLRLALALTLWFAAHFFLYFSCVRLFAIESPGIRRFLSVAALVLSLSFIAAAYLARIYGNLFTSAFYALSAFWTGLALYLLMAAVVSWVIALTGRAMGRTPPLRSVSTVFFLAAFLYSVYGVWNAFHPVIKTVEVEMPGLSENWRHKTIVNVADVHLGAVHTPEYFSALAATINSLKPDLILITGDLFDGMSSPRDLSPFIRPLNELGAADGIFFVTGNHENYIGVERVLSALAKTKIRALRDEAVEMEGLQIIGVEYPGPGVERDIKKTLLEKGLRKGMPTLLLYHTPTNIEQKNGNFARRQTMTYWAPDIDYSAAKELGVNLQISGHTHGGQLFPFNLLARRLYKGYDYGLKRDGDFSIYISCGVGTFGPSIRTGSRPEIVVIRLKSGS